MIKALIIDDEPKCISLIQTILEKNCKSIKVSGSADSFETAYHLIQEQQPDLLFLDVEMPYGSGLELLERFPVHDFEVIFITAYDRFALPALKAEALDYILKPFTENDLVNSVKKAEQRIKDKRIVRSKDIISERNLAGKRIALPTMEGLVFINMEDIIRCEASGSYTTFHLLHDRKILVSKNLSDYTEMLEPFDFFRIHASHLINIRFVRKYIKGRGGYVVLEDGTTIDVSARKKLEFIDNLFK